MESKHILLLIAIVCALVLVLASKLLRRVPKLRFTPIKECPSNKIGLKISGDANPAMVVEARIGTHECLFMIDTGYAGAPVLSLPMLACERKISEKGTIDQRVAACIAAVNAYRVTQREQESALLTFMDDQGCVEYTSGCTTRLMGIGQTSENTSAILLCPSLELKVKGASKFTSCKACASLPNADMFGTSRMTGLHILTIDFLMHVSPCILSPARGELEISIGASEYLRARAGFVKCASEFSGGSFVTTLVVGGERVQCTVDTGASSFLSLSSSAAARIRKCSQESPQRIRQVGVNGENVCSDVVLCDVEFCQTKFSEIPVFLNDYDLDDVDGYVGLSLLRAFDLLITTDELACRYNGAELRTDQFQNILTSGNCASTPACATPGA